MLGARLFPGIALFPSFFAAVRRARATPVATTPAAVAGVTVVVPPETTVTSIAVLVVSVTVATIAATTVVTGAVVCCLGCQTVDVIRESRPEPTLEQGRVGALKSVAEGAHDNRNLLDNALDRAGLGFGLEDQQPLFQQLL